jgi:hypothetical protein
MDLASSIQRCDKGLREAVAFIVSFKKLQEVLCVCVSRAARGARCEYKEGRLFSFFMMAIDRPVGQFGLFVMTIDGPVRQFGLLMVTIGRPVGQLGRLIKLNDSMRSRSTDTKGVDACSAYRLGRPGLGASRNTNSPSFKVD